MTVNRCTDRHARADIYRRAAQIMESEAHIFGSCHALGKAVNGLQAWDYSCGDLGAKYHEVKDPFMEMFGKKSAYWFGRPPRGRSIRVLALCFMAAMAERP